MFRIFLQKLTDDELEFGMRKKLVDEEDLLRVAEGGGLELSRWEKLRRGLRGLSRPGFLRRLNRVVKLMRAVGEHYRAYPEQPDGFRGWKKKAEELFSRAREL